MRLGEAQTRRHGHRRGGQGFCKGQIAHYKIPRYVKFVDTFPMTVTGKVQKFLMPEEMVKELGLSEQKTA